MSDLSHTWQPASAWEGIVSAAAVRGGRRDVAPGVTIAPIDHADMATIICAEGQKERLAQFARQQWEIDVPKPGRASAGGACTLVWSAPDQWLALLRSPDGDALANGLDGIAAVTEQGDSRALIELGGPAIRATLAKGLAIDLDPVAFSEGSAAVTALSHISVQIWQTDAAPTYLLAAPRSVIGHVWDWLIASAAEYGYAVERRATLHR